MKYRSRTDIVALILEAANGRATKTKIMYKAFLSYAQLKEYLTVLLEMIYWSMKNGNKTLEQHKKVYACCKCIINLMK